MKNKVTQANIGMIVGKTFSGLNANALKYLLPLWLGPLSGATFRCVFAAVAFWIIGWFAKPERSSAKDKLFLFILGALAIYGFMALYLVGLSKTTPVSSSIFSSLQPIWVFIIAVIFYKEKVSALKLVGIALGFGGALLCILSQKSDDYASDAFTGNVLCLLSSIAYAIYLVMNKRMLNRVGLFTVLRYTFTGAAFSSIIVSLIAGFDAPLLDAPLHWFPIAALLFVLIFPTVLTYLIVPFALKYLKTTVVAIYGYLILIVATVVALLVGQDRFRWSQMIAIGLIVVSVYLVEVAEGKEEKKSVAANNSDKPDIRLEHES